jgi:hypothetical protein
VHRAKTFSTPCSSRGPQCAQVHLSSYRAPLAEFSHLQYFALYSPPQRPSRECSRTRMWTDPCGIGDFGRVRDTSVVVGRVLIKISQDPSRLSPPRCLRVAMFRCVQYPGVAAIARCAHAKYSADVHPIGNVLLLRFLSKTYGGQSIVYLLQGPLEM